MANWCIAEIYGPTKESVDLEFDAEIKGKVGHHGEFLIPEEGADFLRECEMDYFKFLSMVHSH